MDGFFCKTALRGANGTCVRDAGDGPDSPDAPQGPTYVDEGEECSGSLPPQFAKLCKRGFFCNAPRLGAAGICEREVPDQNVSLPIQVGENQTCNPSLAPQFAILCMDGFFCRTAMPGANGTCVRDAGDGPNVPDASQGPTYVDEGEECNGSLPPQF